MFVCVDFFFKSQGIELTTIPLNNSQLHYNDVKNTCTAKLMVIVNLNCCLKVLITIHIYFSVKLSFKLEF